MKINCLQNISLSSLKARKNKNKDKNNADDNKEEVLNDVLVIKMMLERLRSLLGHINLNDHTMNQIHEENRNLKRENDELKFDIRKAEERIVVLESLLCKQRV